MNIEECIYTEQYTGTWPLTQAEWTEWCFYTHPVIMYLVKWLCLAIFCKLLMVYRFNPSPSDRLMLSECPPPPEYRQKCLNVNRST